jgi:hypothetical protein
MVPLGDQLVVAPHARMDGVLGKLQDGEAGQVLVVEAGEVVGIITPTDLTRWLRRWRALGRSARRAGRQEGRRAHPGRVRASTSSEPPRAHRRLW